jgi:hypothetical protein
MKFTKKDKRIFNLVMKFLVILAWASFVAFIFAELLVPMIFGILNKYLSLLEMYQLLTMPLKFFGGFIILFVTWKIFEALATIWVKITETGLSWIEKETKK